MNLLLILLLNLSGGDVDVSALEKIAIQDDGRIKPFDTFARECLDLWTGKQSFQSFKDPSSGEKVEVFSSPNATVSILELISDPEGATSKRLIKIQHPDLKKKLGFTIWSHYFSMDELQLQAETLRALYDKAVGKPSSQRGPLDRAVLSLARSISLFEQVVHGVPLRIVPLGYGQMQRWVSIFELQNFLEAGENWLIRTKEYAERFKEEGSDLRYRQAMAMVSDVESCIKVLSSHPRPVLQEIHDDFKAIVGAFSKRGGEAETFATTARRIGENLRSLNPKVYPAAGLLESEVESNRLRK